MDGSSGIAPVIPKGWFALFLATFQVAFAVSGKDAAAHRKKGLALFGRGECDSAVGELLRAVAAGDSSHLVVLNLAQALECDNRLVDALSATYIDHRPDTTGRIDVLLYRAQLLRKLGLADEAEKVEKEAGVVIAATLAADPRDTASPSWNWSPTLSGSFGWTLQNDALSTADSLRLTASMIGVKADIASTKGQPLASTDDSVHIQGEQIPLLATVGVEVDWGGYYVWFGVPAQATLKSDLSDWLATSARALVQAGGQWSNRWFESNATITGAKNWTYYPGYDPIRSADVSGSFEVKKGFAKARWSQSNSGNLSLDSSNGFNGFTGSHSIGFVRGLPWKSDLSIGAGFSWYVDKPRVEFETLSDFKVRVIDVQGIEVGMDNLSQSILFLDSNGVAIPYSNTIVNGQLRNGLHPAQRVESRDGYAYPLESKLDWRKWNGGIQLSKSFPRGVVAKIGVDLARIELVHLQRGTYVPEASLYTDRWVSSGGMTTGVGEMILYRDVRTGEEYWVGEPAKGSYVGPILFQRHRVDHAVTFATSATWTPWRHLSATAGWTWVRNRSNLVHLVEGSSYTRNLWNASATVSW
jgi:hypothetical protein